MFDVMLGDDYGDSYVGTMSFCGTLAYVAGGLVSSYLTDLYFYRHMKHVIFSCMTLNTVSCLLFIASVPNEADRILLDFGRGWILFVTSLCGFFNGAAAPIFYELLAEITYPVDEAISGGIASMCENLGALVLYQVVARLFPATDMNYAFTFGMTVTIALSSLVQQRYNRSYSSVPTTAEEEAASAVMEGSHGGGMSREMIDGGRVSTAAVYEKA
jgi:MFS family permease